MEDLDLVREAARGEVDALSALYDRFSGLLVSMAYKMLGDVGAAEDLVHDVFLEVWRRAHAYDPARGTVRTWILVRLRSRALDRLRSVAHRREILGEALETSSPTVSSEDPALAPDRTAVVRALSDLPAEQRRVLELAYFQGLTSAEIAACLGCPIGTVKSRTAAGLNKLRIAMALLRSPT
jgi:RNA polymerase sigma-70 factor (ECF subfamily)